MTTTATVEAPVNPITTAARRIARESRPGWRTRYTAAGEYRGSTFDPERSLIRWGDYGPDEWDFEVSGKCTQREAQDRIDAATELVALGHKRIHVTGALADVLADWEWSDERGKPREDITTILDRTARC